MSRCFPFPPPGYEKKATVDTIESLTKESQNEKRNKKDKRNREQRDGKERKHKKHKDKDRVKEKHGDKKDSKEDKKKDRDSTQNQKTFEEQSRKYQVEKHGKNTPNLGICKESVKDFIKYGAGMLVSDNAVDKSLARGVGASRMPENGSEIVSKMDRNLIVREKRTDMGHTLVDGANGNNTFSNSAVLDQRKHVSTSRVVERATSTRSDGKHGEMVNIWIDGAVDSNMSSDLINSEHRSSISSKRNPPASNLHNLLGKIGTSRMVEKGRETDTRTERHTVISEREIGTIGKLLVEGASANNAGFDDNPKKRSINGFLYGWHEGKNNMLESVSVNKGQQKTNVVNSQKLEVALEMKASEANSVGESKKPHPDEKYLSQILLVPKIEELSTVDDQKWLFGSSDLRQKPKTSSMTAKTQEVWSGALRVGEPDILALPYVIPY